MEQTLYVLAAADSGAAAAKQTIAKVEALAEIKLHDRTGAGGDRRGQRLYLGEQLLEIEARRRDFRCIDRVGRGGVDEPDRSHTCPHPC